MPFDNLVAAGTPHAGEPIIDLRGRIGHIFVKSGGNGIFTWLVEAAAAVIADHPALDQVVISRRKEWGDAI